MARAEYYPEACFNCQQAAEKALKAFMVFQGKKLIKTHSLRELSIETGKFIELKPWIAPLDVDYTATRYIDVTLKRPSDTYTEERFLHRFECAKNVLEAIESWTSR